MGPFSTRHLRESDHEEDLMASADQQAITGGYGSLNGSMQTFLSEVRTDLEQGMLSPRVLNDPDIHRAELDRIFTRCWIFVGHVSEIPSPGDYVLRYVGEDQFILVRDENGEIQLLLNNCVHRASPVCRSEKGNTSHFRCPYHGWIYKNSGEWNGAPYRTKAYRKLDAERWGLLKAPQVDSYQGLIFACLDPEAVPLREYLGDMCWYLDVLFGLKEQGMRVVGEPHRWIVPSNWKSGAENFAGDGYHVQSAHRSLADIGLIANERSADGLHVSLNNGHGVLVIPRPVPESFGPTDYPSEVASTFELDRLDDGQRAFLARHAVVGFTVFPNLSLFRAAGVGEDGRPTAVQLCLRQWQPRGPEQMELWNWPMVWDSAPEEFNQASYDASIFSFGPSGVFEQDDTVVWRGGPMVGRSAFARKDMKLNFQMGMDGMSDYEDIPDWMGPGEASTTFFGERNQRRWWQRWSEALASS
jgi:phenylpropionate dioxygenase-like ring-hydroxylating dioxygenase large terminal subunit